MPALTTLAQRTDAIAITRGQVSLLARTPPCRPPARARARAKKKKRETPSRWSVSLASDHGLPPNPPPPPPPSRPPLAMADGLHSFALPRGSLLSPSKKCAREPQVVLLC